MAGFEQPVDLAVAREAWLAGSTSRASAAASAPAA